MKFHVNVSLNLMVDVDDAVFHIQVCKRQSTKLGNTHSGVEQDEYDLVVFAVDAIVVYKLQEFTHLVSGNRLAGYAVVYDNPGKLELEWILDQDVIIHGHLEGWS